MKTNRIQIIDYTSRCYNTTRRNVESKIGSFAFKVKDIKKANKFVDFAKDLGLNSVRLGNAGWGDYITFGVSNSKDISYKEYRSDIPTGVKIIKGTDNIVRAIEKMADKKSDLYIDDILRDKTYRELATGNAKRKTARKRPTSKRKSFDVVVSDHYVIPTCGGIAFKKPRDKFDVYLSI